jgi:hypothetical protein
MATRSHSWFDASKLLAGESLVREDRARVRIEAPPHWWEGTLVLTTERLFLIRHVEHPTEEHTAFWLAEIVRVHRIGRAGFIVAARDGSSADVRMLAPGVSGLMHGPAREIIGAIEALRPLARMPDADTSSRQAAG